MSKALRSQLSRQKLLDAAESVVLEKGVTNLTLDAVAAAAGVSKGGLLYHFPSKDALVMALVENMVAEIVEEFESALAVEPEGPGRKTRAILAISACRTGQAHQERRDRLGAALLAAAGNNPDLLKPMQEVFSKCMEDVGDDGLEPGVPLIVAAALDGLMFWQLFGLYTPPRANLKQAMQFLEKLARVKS